MRGPSLFFFLGGGVRFPDTQKVRVPLHFATHFSVLYPLARVGGSDPTASMDVVSFVLSCRGLCVGLITRPEESYRVPVILNSQWWGGPGPLGALAHHIPGSTLLGRGSGMPFPSPCS